MKEFFQKANELDNKDPLARFKDLFVNDSEVIYLDGNSLGKLPKKTIELQEDIIKKQWGEKLIRSWNENWLNVSKNLSKKLAHILGARADEIFVGDSTSINLYKLAYAALEANPGRNEIISDSLNFPTDHYVLQGLIQNHFKNKQLTILESKDLLTIELGQIEKALSKNTALLTLSHVAYKSAFMYDMEKVNNLAHESNTLVLWDLSHAAGAVPIDLNLSNSDMAVGCTYKYLNGGPGAPAFLFVRKDLQEKLQNPIWSWFGHQSPFEFKPDYRPHEGIKKFGTGTPSILSLSAIEPGLEIICDAGINNLRRKSVSQSQFLLEMISEELIKFGFEIASPKDWKIRGSHISLMHPKGYAISRSMIEPKVPAKIIIPDFRPPNNIRLGIAPLYNSFNDLCETVARLKEIMEKREYDFYEDEILEVP